MEWYPLAFEPIMKKVLWGGSALADFKQLPFDSPQTGESWEISAVEGNVSLLGNGALKGKKLDELISLDPEGLLGSKVYEGYGADFPLLIKWIDTAADLSIQVHPDDAFARTQGRRFGKTELWYVVRAEPEARLIAGFNKKLSREEYLRRIAENSIEEVLLQHPVQAGDVFMIPPGRVHSIGKGILLAEIQQSSDITYRIYDFNRKDDQGNARPLHTELAAQCLDFGHYSDYKTTYPGLPNQAVELNRNKYFRVNRLELKAGEPKLEMERNPAGGKSFVVYMCLEGALELHCSNGSSGCLSRGRTLLIPAAAGSCLLQCKDAALVLEIFAEC
ncbi:MAG: class I mannose-6-phosphate isomerase [Bacteroidales bacterium]|nr:class I mannose-6-phosphate isomerase [Bacteroidales bacterium]